MQGADRSCKTKQGPAQTQEGCRAAMRQQHQEAAGITRDATAGAGPRTCRLLLDHDCLASRLCLSWQLPEQQQSRAGGRSGGGRAHPRPLWHCEPLQPAARSREENSRSAILKTVEPSETLRKVDGVLQRPRTSRERGRSRS